MVTKSVIFILVLLMVITAGCGTGVVVPRVEPNVLTITVTDYEEPPQPLEGIKVKFTRDDYPDYPTEYRETNSDGKATYSPTVVDKYIISCQTPGYSYSPYYEYNWFGGSENFEFRAEHGILTTVKDNEGDPFREVRLIITKPDGGIINTPGVETDHRGEFVYLPYDVTGDYTITPEKGEWVDYVAYHWTFEPESQTVTWEDNGPILLDDFEAVSLD